MATRKKHEDDKAFNSTRVPRREHKVLVGFSAPISQVDWLEDQADQRRVSVSEVIRDLVQAAMS